jgi:hypothetical protein
MDGRPADIGVLRKWPTERQWLVDVPGAPVNFAFNALAALTLLGHPDGASGADHLARLILTVKGRRLDQSAALRQDNSLQAWPWVDGTFSWGEPTSLCLLLVKKLRARLGAEAVERIEVAETMLRDRACRDGGWNYGSSNVYGQELFPYVPTTALGLIALQDRTVDPVVVAALRYLEANYASEATPMALSLSIIALGVHARPVTAVHAVLVERLPKAFDAGSTLGRAMSLYALADASHGDTIFRL